MTSSSSFRVLIATDGSPSANAALATAAGFGHARQRDGRNSSGEAIPTRSTGSARRKVSNVSSYRLAISAYTTAAASADSHHPRVAADV